MFVLGAIQALSARFDMNPDGISYLNLSDLYARGDWNGAVNAYWSPLYPWLLGMFARVTGPSVYWEAPTAHALNFILYLATFASFLFFLRQLTELQHTRQSRLGRNVRLITYAKPLELVCAVTLFLWSALILIGLGNVTPDMLLAGIVYGIAGVSVRLHLGRAGLGLFVLLGILLGVGYLTKAVMFPIGLMVALTCALGLGGPQIFFSRTLIVLATFLVIASPQVIAVSRLTNQLSFGENGTIQYAILVNHYPSFWVGNPPGSGIPTHPVQQFRSKPAAYAFPSSERSYSYPFWDQQAYWAAGIRPHFSIREQKAATKPIIYMYVAFLGSLLFAACALFLSRAPTFHQGLPYLLIPAIGTFVLYSLIYAETRYLGAWTLVLFLAAISAIAFPAKSMRGVNAVLATLALFKSATVANEMIYRTHETLRIVSGHGVRHHQFDVASELRTLGLREGSRVASIGRAFDGYWARLAGVQISMQILEGDAPDYWSASDSAKAAIQEEFAARGAKAIVANQVPAGSSLGPQWVALDRTGYFGLIIDSPDVRPVPTEPPPQQVRQD